MQSILSRSARDLDGAARAALESLLGRPLDESEQVTVVASPAHTASSGEQRQQAARRLEQHLNDMAASAGDVAVGELEALVDEACEQVRGRQP